MIDDVKKFHEKFGLPTGREDVLSGDDSLIRYRLGFLREELEELDKALAEGDRVGAFDALLDLVYVAHGTALMLGIDPHQWHSGMAAVQAANMAKVRCADASESKRGHSADVRKPDGWVGPEARLREILAWSK